MLKKNGPKKVGGSETERMFRMVEDDTYPDTGGKGAEAVMLREWEVRLSILAPLCAVWLLRADYPRSNALWRGMKKDRREETFTAAFRRKETATKPLDQSPVCPRANVLDVSGYEPDATMHTPLP